jgi:hypothetical protein
LKQLEYAPMVKTKTLTEWSETRGQFFKTCIGANSRLHLPSLGANFSVGANFALKNWPQGLVLKAKTEEL